jgi:hypothetical protein
LRGLDPASKTLIHAFDAWESTEIPHICDVDAWRKLFPFWYDDDRRVSELSSLYWYGDHRRVSKLFSLWYEDDGEAFAGVPVSAAWPVKR